MPTTSLGTPWNPAAPRMWKCLDCGQSGPDRDDLAFPTCTVHGSGGSHTAFRFVEPDGTELTMLQHRAKRRAL